MFRQNGNNMTIPSSPTLSASTMIHPGQDAVAAEGKASPRMPRAPSDPGSDSGDEGKPRQSLGISLLTTSAREVSSFRPTVGSHLMSDLSSTAFTRLLLELRTEDVDRARLLDRVYCAVYGELKKIAQGLMNAEPSGHTLRPTALVHEAYLKLVEQEGTEWQDRAHFLGIATRAMRQILVDHARRRLAAKRGRGWDRVTLDECVGARPDQVFEIIELDRVLKRLAELSTRMARVVEMRIFGGMTHQEIAVVVAASPRTVANDWSVARRWLARELAPGGAS